MKIYFTVRKALILLALVPTLSLSAENWDFIIAPYGLLPSIKGDASVGIVEGADIDVGADDILENLELGGMIQVEALHRSGFGAKVAYNFMDLESKTSGPGGGVTLKAEIFQGIFEGYGMYRMALERSTLDFYGGVRWWDMGLDMFINDTPVSSADEDWVDPVIGVRWIPQISDKWHLMAKGDIGGFGVGSDFTWNLQGGVAWDATRWLTLVLQYRALSVDYSSGSVGSADRFAYDTITHGPLLGLAFRF